MKKTMEWRDRKCLKRRYALSTLKLNHSTRIQRAEVVTLTNCSLAVIMTPVLTVATTTDKSNTKLVTILQMFTTIAFVGFSIIVLRRCTGIQHRKVMTMTYGALTNCTIVLPRLTIAPALVVLAKGYMKFLTTMTIIMRV